jgi:anti-sigma factor RsiW
MERLAIEDVDEDEVNAYIDNQLPEHRVAAVEAHLRAHPDLATQVAADREIARTLRDCAVVTARPAVTGWLRDELVRVLQTAQVVRRRTRREEPAVITQVST